MLDALALFPERQPARSVVQLGCVRQVYQHLENREVRQVDQHLENREVRQVDQHLENREVRQVDQQLENREEGGLRQEGTTA